MKFLTLNFVRLTFSICNFSQMKTKNKKYDLEGCQNAAKSSYARVTEMVTLKN